MSGGRGRRRRARGRPDASGSDESRLVVGLNPVRELLRSGRAAHEVLVADTRESGRALAEVLELAGAAGVGVRRVARDRLDALAPGLVHQGVVARADPFRTVPLTRVLEVARDEAPLLVALDGVTDPHNLGSIARTAEAVGAHGLLVPRRRSAGVTPVSEKAAAGALAHLPVVAVTNLARTLDDLRDRGIWSLGLAAEAASTLGEHPLVAEPCTLVVGAEGAGLARLTRQRCDALVRLPMRGRVGSLNASVAAGVALYTIWGARTSRG